MTDVQETYDRMDASLADDPALRAVLRLHRPDSDGDCSTGEEGEPWPCPTVRAMLEAFTADGSQSPAALTRLALAQAVAEEDAREQAEHERSRSITGPQGWPGPQGLMGPPGPPGVVDPEMVRAEIARQLARLAREMPLPLYRTPP